MTVLIGSFTGLSRFWEIRFDFGNVGFPSFSAIDQIVVLHVELITDRGIGCAASILICHDIRNVCREVTTIVSVILVYRVITGNKLRDDIGVKHR